ncbi:MAG: ATP-dependent Clp protease ATP-binding subunit [Ruminococcus sp.]|nr:ATP-dependent Clp protease ATP-binding subunit [Ruminococcus sp.]
MLCEKCKQREAVTVIPVLEDGKRVNKNLCMPCASEAALPNIDNLLEQMGINDEFMSNIADGMQELMNGEDFEDGGINIMPMVQGVFNITPPKPGDKDNVPEKIKSNEPPKADDDLKAKEPGAVPPNGEIPDMITNMLKNMLPPGSKIVNISSSSSADENANSAPYSNWSKSVKTKEKKDDKKKLKYLNNYCTNLSENAAEGKIDNIIGREKEIARVIQILTRRTKNNPCLIGEPGVGKTAIAEGIALAIQSGNVPFNIADKKLYLLDLTALVAGTQFRGQFESRVKGLVEEVKREGNIILFIDEVHRLVSAGDAEGAMNAANILKPALSRGEVQVVGATTFTEYRKHIEKDSALERRFQPITVNESTIDDTIEILKGIKVHYQDFHMVKISDYLLRSCAVLSERYITGRFLPDKAIDLMDESMARCNIKHTELSRYNKLLTELEKTRELYDITKERNEEAAYESQAITKSHILKLEKEIEELKPAIDEIGVDEEDIAKVIELWTGIPANKIEETEFSKIGKLEEVLKQHIIGQDEALTAVAKAVKRSRVQLTKRRRPASFIFVGPTGVGKTELVKVLSEELFNDTDPLIRLDMSEFMEKHAVSRLVGSPPGYVGYDDAGQFTEKIRRKPYSVVLFDEIEKAHPDIMNILLQILDEGRIKDAQGRDVNFENTVIVMTSNAGMGDKSSGVGFAKSADNVTKDKAMKALKEFLRPEFLGRIDEIVVFKNLSKENFAEIAELMLEEMREPLAEKSIELEYTDNALKAIADKAHGHESGARDIRNVIRSEVEDRVAEVIIEKMGYVDKIVIDEKDGKLTVDYS